MKRAERVTVDSPPWAVGGSFGCTDAETFTQQVFGAEVWSIIIAVISLAPYLTDKNEHTVFTSSTKMCLKPQKYCINIILYS